MPTRLLATYITLLVVTAPGRAADWPQFRGPGGTGVVTGTVVPPDTWTGTQNVAWKYEVPGHGWSCPIVVGGKVFVTSCVTDSKLAAPKTGFYAPTNTKTHDGEHRWTLFCLDAATGKVLWERVAHKGKPQHPIHVKASYASETPVSDGERVYAYFGNVGLFCYDFTGKLLWSRSWDVVPTQLNWGTGASPVLHKDRLYIVNDNEKQSFIVALDKLTGKDVWKVDRAEKSNWATPFVWENGKRTEIVTCGKGKVRSYDLDGQAALGAGRHVVDLRALSGRGERAAHHQLRLRVRPTAAGLRGPTRRLRRHLPQEGRVEESGRDGERVHRLVQGAGRCVPPDPARPRRPSLRALFDRAPSPASRRRRASRSTRKSGWAGASPRRRGPTTARSSA